MPRNPTPPKQKPARPNPEPAPKMPNERDQTPDAGNEPRPIIEQAHKDVTSGKQDTDRGPVMDRTYRQLKKP